MLHCLRGGFSALKIAFGQRHETESFIFFLQYRVTCLMLLGCSIMFALLRLVEHPIVCTSRDDIPTNFVNAFCWSSSTFSVNTTDRKVGIDIPYQGVNMYSNDRERTYRDYYQWFVLSLFIQGVLFYIPHAIWMGIENGRFDRMVSMIRNPSLDNICYLRSSDEESPKDSETTKLQKAAIWLVSRWGWNDTYARWYFICEILAFLNVAFQIRFLNHFFHGQFLGLGLKTKEYLFSGHDDNPLAGIFPLLTKCTIHRYGASGDIQRHDMLCALPHNAVAEKVYLFLWFWFFLLCALNILAVLKTFSTWWLPFIRSARLQMRASGCQRRMIREVKRAVSEVGRDTSFGDWFVIYSLARRMDSLDFKLLLTHIKEERDNVNDDDKRASDPKLHSSGLWKCIDKLSCSDLCSCFDCFSNIGGS